MIIEEDSVLAEDMLKGSVHSFLLADVEEFVVELNPVEGEFADGSGVKCSFPESI